MKYKLLAISITILFTLALTNQVMANETEDDDHHEIELISEKGTMRAPDQCNETTLEITITSKDAKSLDYDADEYNLEKNTCYKLTFQNLSPVLEHDFTIDEVEGEDGIEPIVLHATNSSSGLNEDGKVSMNILTPNADTEFYTRCTVEGHEAAGMNAILIIGDGNTGFLPGFEVAIALTSIFAIGLITRFRK